MKILNFTVSNYKSIADTMKIYFTYRTCIIGGRGQGKSNILKALELFVRIIQEQSISFITQPLYFKLQDNYKNKPTTFSISFRENNIVYNYELSIIFKGGKYDIIKDTGIDKLQKISKFFVFDLDSRARSDSKHPKTYQIIKKVLDDEKRKKFVLSFLNRCTEKVVDIKAGEFFDINVVFKDNHNKEVSIPLEETGRGITAIIVMLSNIYETKGRGVYVIDDIDDSLDLATIEEIIFDILHYKHKKRILFTSSSPLWLTNLEIKKIWMMDKEFGGTYITNLKEKIECYTCLNELDKNFREELLQEYYIGHLGGISLIYKKD
jgi:AAA15 family ATPase/GTPase